MGQLIIVLCCGLGIGFICGIFVTALMRANDTVETCHKCRCVCDFKTSQNNWHYCDLYDATGKVKSK